MLIGMFYPACHDCRCAHGVRLSLSQHTALSTAPAALPGLYFIHLSLISPLQLDSPPPFTDQLLTNVNPTNSLLHRDPDPSAATELAERHDEIKLLANTLCSCSDSRPCPSDCIRYECGSCFISYAESRSELQPPWHLYGSSLHGHHLLLTLLRLLLSPMTPDPFGKQKESLWPTVWWSFISLCRRFTPFALFFFFAMAAPAPLVLMEKRRGCGREGTQEWLGHWWYTTHSVLKDTDKDSRLNGNKWPALHAALLFMYSVSYLCLVYMCHYCWSKLTCYKWIKPHFPLSGAATISGARLFWKSIQLLTVETINFYNKDNKQVWFID